MNRILALILCFFSITLTVSAQNQLEQNSSSGWSSYGYIIIGAIILLVAFLVLWRKQHRKFNE